MELNKLIDLMEKRPLMYMKNYDIEMLSTFIDGFLYGKSVSSNVSIDEDLFRPNFSFWVQEYYGEKPTSHGWASVILYHEGSHRKAVEKFFELYKEWYENPENRLKTYV